MRIVFAHNVYNRFDTLKNTIAIEKDLYPNSYSVIAYNEESPIEVLKEFTNVELVKFDGLTHKIGCTNGCIRSIQESIKYNPNVIVFSHDDVSLVPSDEAQHSFLLNASDIKECVYDVICRRPIPKDNYGEKYYLMEAFFISKNAAEKAFSGLTLYEHESHISKDARGSISPEVFLYETLNNKGLNIFEREYYHTLDNYNNTLSDLMGFTHKNAGERGWTD